LKRFFADPKLQRLKQKALEIAKKSDRKYTKADSEYARALIRKSFFLSGYEKDMIQRALRKSNM
jgi:hypothetical protein